MIPIKSLQHIGIPVSNLAQSEPFYQKLGFKTTMRKPFDYEGGKGTCIMMELNAIVLELYQFPDPIIPSITGRKDGHIDHICFDVDDVNECFRIAKENGYNVLEEAPVHLNFWEKGVAFFNITGPDGERLEFNQIFK